MSIKRKNNRTKKSEKKQESPAIAKIFLFSIIILATGISVYISTVSFDYVYCDDHVFVLDNYAFNSDLSNVLTSFKKTLGTSFYRPILTISYIINANIGGRDPNIYHITNVIIHLLGSLLVFFTLLRLGYSHENRV